MIRKITTNKHGNHNHGAMLRAVNMLIEEHNSFVLAFNSALRFSILSSEQDPNFNEEGVIGPCINLEDANPAE